MKKYFSIVALCLVLFSCKTATSPQNNSGTTLTAVKIADADAPNVNSSSVEPIWGNTTGILTLNPDKIGANFPSGSVTNQISIQSVVTSSDIYFLVQFDDPDSNYLDVPLRFTGGDPANRANWVLDQTIHDDGVSLIFEMLPGKTGTMTFAANGCAMLCHAAQKDFGGGLIAQPGMYPENSGRYDLWYWRTGKGNGSGYADDEVSIGTPNYASQLDIPNNEDIFDNNVDNDMDGNLPFYVAGGTNRNLNKKYFIAKEMEQFFGAVNPSTGKTWTTGDVVPSNTLSLPGDPTDDNFDVTAHGFWSAGKWNVIFKRKLSTGHTDTDVQLASGNSHLFSVAVHNNNAPGNHFGYANQPITLKIP